MRETGGKRVVYPSGLCTGDSRAMSPFFYKYLVFPLILHLDFADHEHQERVVKNCPPDRVLVRPVNFVKGTLTSAYRHGFSVADEPPKLGISYEDVTEFMLKQPAGDSCLKNSPIIS